MRLNYFMESVEIRHRQVPFHKFYGFEADEVARKLLPLSAEQARRSLNRSTTKVSAARLKRK